MGDFLTDIGRADKGRTFVRVRHVPSGKERIIVGLDGRDPREVAGCLTRDLKLELNIDEGLDPASSNRA